MHEKDKKKNMEKMFLWKSLSVYYNLIAIGTLLQVATSFVTNCDRLCYKLRRPLLQIATGITTCDVITDYNSTRCKYLLFSIRTSHPGIIRSMN